MTESINRSLAIALAMFVTGELISTKEAILLVNMDGDMRCFTGS